MTDQLALLISSVQLTKDTIKMIEKSEMGYGDQDFLDSLRVEYDEHVDALLAYGRELIEDEKKTPPSLLASALSGIKHGLGK